MNYRTQTVFLLLILTQAAHSAEEYFTKLYDILPPARFVGSLFSNDLARGFLIANVLLVLFGLWCWAVPVRRQWPSARAVAWFWTILEFANGTNHSILAISRGGYFSGVATAPLLLALSLWLGMLLLQSGRESDVFDKTTAR